MIIMSVDLGKARTGIAVCDATQTLASPVTTLKEYNSDRLLDRVAQLAAEKNAELVVVGLPKNMDGTEGESAQNARDFADKLQKLTGIPTDMQDERGTTITAHSFLNETNTRGKKRKNVIDIVSAVIILEDYLARRRAAKDREVDTANF